MRTMTMDEWNKLLLAAERACADEVHGRYTVGAGVDRCVAVALNTQSDALELGAALYAEGLGWVARSAQAGFHTHPHYRDGAIVVFPGVDAPADAPYVNDDDEED